MVEQELKELILSRYGNLKRFSEEIDIAWSTLDGVIKRGVNKANISSLIKICEGLNIDCESLYYGRILPKQELLKSAPLNEKEEAVIEKYRSIDMNGKETVDYVLNDIYARCVKEPETIYTTKMIDKYPHLASAGTGEYLFDSIPIEKINVDEDCKADFAVGIYGDSMEPTYYDGETVLVKKQECLIIGEIGIFIADGDSFIKEYGGDRLISHNKQYDDILFDENMDIRIVGKVIGTYEE